MLSAAIVIFREVFEIVLIVGIILAATRGIPNRLKAVGLGFGGGLAGAGLVALFTKEISQLAEGVGQEIFNASILFIAGLFIGWTVLWMRKHAREMKAHFTQVGYDVASGKLPYFSLSLIIALAMLREGSEIVLFAYGMLASGMGLLSLAGGAAIGLAGGLVLGLALYWGLVKFSVKNFFHITSWILMMLVAGMMSQAIGFLIAAGMIDSLSRPLWDTSWLLSDGSIAGQSLKTLIGYTARPAVMQVIAYALTLGTLLFLTEISSRIRAPAKAAAATAALLVISLWPLPAGAVGKMTTPYIVKGELEIEWQGSYAFDHRADKDGGQEHEFEIEYGLTNWWLMELAGAFERENDDEDKNLNFSEVELATRFQLTEPGEHWLDAGLQLAYIHVLEDDSAKAVEAKLLLAKDVGRFSHLANIVFETEIGNHAEHGVAAEFAWNTRYRYDMHFEPGIEWHSDFGIIDDGSDFNEQEHVVGPAVFGRITPHIKYQVGYFAGLSRESPDHSFRGNLEYERFF
jgi:FTR1 family protein